MARVMRTAAERRAEAGGDPRCRFVKRSARRLLTVKVFDPARSSKDSRVSDLKGVLVRFEPAPDASDAEVRQCVEFFASVGAERVKVLPRPATQAVVVAEQPAVSGTTARELVEQMAEEAVTQDREALKLLLGKAMDQGER